MRLRNMKIFLESIDINATVAWNTWIDLLNLAGDETADPTVGERTILTIQRGWGSCEFFSFLFERHWNLTWIERRGIGKRENIKTTQQKSFRNCDCSQQTAPCKAKTVADTSLLSVNTREAERNTPYDHSDAFSTVTLPLHHLHVNALWAGHAPMTFMTINKLRPLLPDISSPRRSKQPLVPQNSGIGLTPDPSRGFGAERVALSSVLGLGSQYPSPDIRRRARGCSWNRRTRRWVRVSPV